MRRIGSSEAKVANNEHAVLWLEHWQTKCSVLRRENESLRSFRDRLVEVIDACEILLDCLDNGKPLAIESREVITKTIAEATNILNKKDNTN